MKKVKSRKNKILPRVNFSIQKRITFDNQKKIGNILSKAFKKFTPLKF